MLLFIYNVFLCLAVLGHFVQGVVDLTSTRAVVNRAYTANSVHVLYRYGERLR